VTLTLLCPGALANPVEPERVLAQVSFINRVLRQIALLPLSVDARPAAGLSESPGGVSNLRETPEESWLRQHFKVPQNFRLGAFAAQGASGLTQARLVVRPVNLHIGLDHLVLSAPSELQLNADESADLMNSANDWLLQEGVRFQALSTDLWDAVLANDSPQTLTQLDAASSRMATGRNIDAWMVQGPEARTWRRLCNEVQMLWHTHPVNQRREARGAMVVNGLWLEGGFGPLPATQYDQLIATDPAWQGLARAAGLSADQLVSTQLQGIEKRLADAASQRRVLAISEDWHRALLSGNAEQWLAAWSSLDQLLAATAARVGLSQIQLICTGQHSCWQLSLSAQARWIPPLRASLSACFEERA
jgi:hypothetical protein